MKNLEHQNFGLCCVCGADGSSNFVLLKRLAPVPGTGWGCALCGLPPNGAIAICCEKCVSRAFMGGITQVVYGMPTAGGRCDLSGLKNSTFDHDQAQHNSAIRTKAFAEMN